MDGKRTRVTKYDLCDHVWQFHFNKEAPEYWRNLDHFWKGGGPLRSRYFHPDGSLTADSGDKTWVGHESCYCVVTSYIGEEKIREHYVRINRWASMSVYRKQDWSWNMSNHLYCYSSIPDADKHGGTGPPFRVV
ncbi:hypothetical protein PanWU01x14_330990 [Parasponia andersonii]|uniref:Uncharacterized protein n=1 Tax=Parasponia andersonii TaxID=3476 RepID=A0A2P5AHW8_PARAD|nr:hypothetical protein PanWU01x14_330990 [Parasponia andersonii]